MNEQCNLRDKRESAPLVSMVVDTYNHESFIGGAMQAFSSRNINSALWKFLWSRTAQETGPRNSCRPAQTGCGS